MVNTYFVLSNNLICSGDITDAILSPYRRRVRVIIVWVVALSSVYITYCKQRNVDSYYTLGICENVNSK